MTQAIMQIVTEGAKAVVQTMSQAAGHKRNYEAAAAASMSARTNGPSLKHPIFNWKAQDKYNELLSFEMEIKPFL